MSPITDGQIFFLNPEHFCIHFEKRSKHCEIQGSLRQSATANPPDSETTVNFALCAPGRPLPAANRHTRVNIFTQSIGVTGQHFRCRQRRLFHVTLHLSVADWRATEAIRELEAQIKPVSPSIERPPWHACERIPEFHIKASSAPTI